MSADLTSSSMYTPQATDFSSRTGSLSLTQLAYQQRVVIFIGCFLGLCLIGLTHGKDYLLQHKHGISVELGTGIEDQEAFEKNVNAAPIHRKLGFVGLLAIAGYCFLTTPRNVAVRPSVVLLLIGCCLMLVMSSYLWSVSRGETRRELIRIVAYTGVAFALARRFQPRELLKVLTLMVGISVMAAVAVDIVMGSFRPWSGSYRMHGTLHSSLLAHQALIALLVAFAFYKSSAKPWVWKSIFLAMLTVIILTKTRGALASGIFGCTAILMVGRNFRSTLFVVSTLGTAILAVALFVVMMGSAAQEKLQEVAVLGRSKGVGTLTGRVPLWQAILKESRDRHLQGYGYGAFWNAEQTTKFSKELGWFPGHAHSAYLQCVLDLGYVGAATFLCLVFCGLIRSVRLLRFTGNPAYRFVFGLLMAGLLDGIVEVSFVYPRELGLFVGIALVMLVVTHIPTGVSMPNEPENNQDEGCAIPQFA